MGVIGHVEHITLGRVPAVPAPGDIAHLDGPVRFPGGGGGVAFFQLAKSDAELHLFSALGRDQAAEEVEARLAATGAALHLARRDAPHTRDVVMIDPSGERTIVVVGEPLFPVASDPLPWALLQDMEAVYFTARDPELLRRSRAARRLLATARRRAAIEASGVELDAVLGSVADPRERAARRDFAPPPGALVMTEGARGGRVETAAGVARYPATPAGDATGGAYGAGDSFAGAFTYHLAAGHGPLEAARRAAAAGAAALGALDPLEAQMPLAP